MTQTRWFLIWQLFRFKLFFFLIAPIPRASQFLTVRDSLWGISWGSRARLRNLREDTPAHTIRLTPCCLDWWTQFKEWLYFSLQTLHLPHRSLHSIPAADHVAETNSLWCPGPDEVHMRLSNKALALFLNNLRRLKGGRSALFSQAPFPAQTEWKTQDPGRDSMRHRENQTLRRRQECKTRNGCKA